MILPVMTSRAVTRRAFLKGSTPRDTVQPPSKPAAPAADFLLRVNRQIMACRVEVVLPGCAANQAPILTLVTARFTALGARPSQTIRLDLARFWHRARVH